MITNVANGYQLTPKKEASTIAEIPPQHKTTEEGVPES